MKRSANTPFPTTSRGAKKLLAEAGWMAGADGKLAKAGKPLMLRIAGSKTQNSGPEIPAGGTDRAWRHRHAQCAGFQTAGSTCW